MYALTIINTTLSRKLPQVAITYKHGGDVIHHTMPKMVNKLVICSSKIAVMHVCGIAQNSNNDVIAKQQVLTGKTR